MQIDIIRLCYFFSFFQIEGASDALAIVEELYTSKIINEALQLPLFHPKYAWTSKISTAVKHLAEHLYIAATQDGLNVAAQCVELLQKQILSPRRIQISRHHRAAGKRKLEKDKVLRKNVADWKRIRVSIRQAMIDLQALWEANKEDGLNQKQRSAGSVAMAGILFFGAPVGRPGEFVKLRVGDVKKLIEEDGWCLVIRAADHKTSSRACLCGQVL